MRGDFCDLVPKLRLGNAYPRSSASPRVPDDALYIQAGSRGVVDAWFSLDASSSSNITNTGVRDPNDPVFLVYNGPGGVAQTLL